MDQIEPCAWEALESADFAARGYLPEPGGVNDQTRSIIDAIKLVWAEESAYKTVGPWSVDRGQ